MSRERRHRLIVTVTSGWAIRNFFGSDIMDALSRKARITVAAAPQYVDYIVNWVTTGHVESVVELDFDEPVVDRLVRWAKKAILQAKTGSRTARIKSSSNSRTTLGRKIKSAAWTVGGILAANWQIRALERIESKRIERLPSELYLPQPTALLNLSPFDPLDLSVQRALAVHGVPCISVIPSWDNLSSKGCISTDVEKVLVWGTTTKEELLRYYPWVSESQVSIVGGPQFDVYAAASQSDGLRSTRDDSRSAARDDEQHTILYATCSPRLFPSEPKIVAALWRAIEGGDFGNARLILRLHPADNLNRYSELLDSDGITLSVSSAGDGLGSWIPPPDETDKLSSLLTVASVCVNTASTMTLDALLAGTPVVNVAFDPGEEDPPAWQSVVRYYQYDHFSTLTRSGRLRLARSQDELHEELHDVLSDTRRAWEAQRPLVNGYGANLVGESAAAIVSNIQDVLARSQTVRTLD